MVLSDARYIALSLTGLTSTGKCILDQWAMMQYEDLHSGLLQLENFELKLCLQPCKSPQESSFELLCQCLTDCSSQANHAYMPFQYFSTQLWRAAMGGSLSDC